MDVILLQAAFYLLFALALIGFIRQPSWLTFDILAMFGAIAGLYAFQILGNLFPALDGALALASILLLLAQPALALRLTRHITRVPRWVGWAMSLAYVAIVAVALALGEQYSWLVVLPLAYFVIGDGGAAVLLGRAAWQRTGLARWRLALASAAMVLTALAVLSSVSGGSIGQTLARLIGLLAAIAFLLSFAPPHWTRRIVQQSIAYGFLRDLGNAQPGSGTALLWQELADAAIGLTGALGAIVRVEGNHEPVATAGSANGLAPHVKVIPFGKRPSHGELQLRTAGPTLFADDDLALLALLGAQTLSAVEREAILVERTAIGERIAAANVELARASAAKSDFLAAMSHELRTPLNAIIGFSELMITPGAAPLTREATVEYAAHIHGAGQHLLELINDILDLSRVEAGRLDLRHEATDVVRLLEGTLATIRPLADVKGLDLDLECPAELTAEVDAARLRQILFNLVSNAIKFTPANGSVHIAATSDGEAFTISVTDTGPGIGEVDHQRIFTAFEQLAPGEVEGTGLGLALVEQLVEAHGGRVGLISSLGAGSTFTVRIPLRRPVLGDVTAVAPDAGFAPLVLVIEDDAAAAELVRVQLHQAGYRTAVATDGESGLVAARDLAPAAILLDILLPGIDGWDVLRQLRADPETSSIPVMVVSVVDDEALGMALGAHDYFVKPVARETLLAAFSRLTLTTKLRQQTVTILAIDDDPVALALYRDSLGAEGFRVTTAPNGREGVAIARAESVDAIILDILLPDIDGFEVAARLKGDPATRGIPILVVTGYALDDRAKARLNGHTLAVLSKGEDAIAGLKEWLGRFALAA